MEIDNLLHTIVKCTICNKDEELQWMPSVNQKLTLKKMCFNCDFWCQKLNWAEFGDEYYDRVVRVDGTHYLISPDPPIGERGFVGHGGTGFYIHFNDGRKVISCNLWCQGNIPDHFKPLLPDNAVFTTKENY